MVLNGPLDFCHCTSESVQLLVHIRDVSLQWMMVNAEPHNRVQRVNVSGELNHTCSASVSLPLQGLGTITKGRGGRKTTRVRSQGGPE